MTHPNDSLSLISAFGCTWTDELAQNNKWHVYSDFNIYLGTSLYKKIIPIYQNHKIMFSRQNRKITFCHQNRKKKLFCQNYKIIYPCENHI